MTSMIATQERPRLKRFFGKNAPLLVVILLIIAMVIAGALMTGRFLTVRNFTNIVEQSTGLGLVSLGQTFAILTAGIDLSVGSVMSLASTLASGLIDKDVAQAIWVIPALLVVCALIGMLNGLLISRLGIHPLIVTLGTGTVLQGATLLYALSPVGGMPRVLEFVAYETVLGVPVGAAIMMVLFLIAAIFLGYTRPGRDIYALGDDAEAARLVGINRQRVLLIVYGFSGLMAGLAGIYLAIRFGVGQPYLGVNYTLASITPVVVGGTMLNGGRGGVLGTLLGVFLVGVLNNLLNFLQVSTHFQLVAQGAIIIAAVSIYVDNRRSRA